MSQSFDFVQKMNKTAVKQRLILKNIIFNQIRLQLNMYESFKYFTHVKSSHVLSSGLILAIFIKTRTVFSDGNILQIKFARFVNFEIVLKSVFTA